MKNILIEQTGSITRMSLNRPERHNTFDDALISEMHSSLMDIQQDTRTRVLILTAQGRNFSAGADLGWMKKMAGYSEEENYQDAYTMAKLFHLLATLNKPTLCLVQGAVIGGGVGLVAACDIVIAEPEASFRLSEVSLGLVPAVVSPYINLAIGERQARRYYLTGEKFNALEAEKLGLVHTISETPTQKGDEIASILKCNGPEAMACIKKRLSAFSSENHQQIMKDTARIIAALRVSNEGQEGISAFFEKRSPRWG